jgi:hypothetical protein
MSYKIVEKFLKPKKYQTEQIRTAEESDVIDPRIKIGLQTRELILKYRLTNRIQPTLSIPLAYNPSRGVFELIETPSLITSRLQAYYYPTAPSETTPDYYNLRVDAQHRLYVIDDQALQQLQSLFNSIGDAGTSPQNATGKTVLKMLTDISNYTYSLYTYFYYPGHAETFTTTPLGANATYYSPSKDFTYSRLSVMNIMGYADQPTAPNGVYIELSLDNANWDYQGATATLTTAGAVSLSQVATARYARAVWVNGSTPQSAFRFGGRYAVAGSENPTVSLAPPTQITPICSICGKDMTETSDFFVENGKVYCPKCYANKRWKEVPSKSEWKKSLKAWRKNAQSEEFNRAKQHTPDDAEDEVS